MAGLATVAALGCQVQVIGGGSGGTGVTTGPQIFDGAGGGGNPPPVPPVPDDGPAIAMLYSELAARSGGSGQTGSSGVGGGSGPDPNTLFIFVSDAAQSCADPYAQGDGCSIARYQVAIGLPPSLQAVGVYPLDQIATFSETDPGGSPDECSGGGGSYWDGTISITAIDAQKVSFTLSGTATLFLTPGNADGAYEAERCVF